MIRGRYSETCMQTIFVKSAYYWVGTELLFSHILIVVPSCRTTTELWCQTSFLVVLLVVQLSKSPKWWWNERRENEHVIKTMRNIILWLTAPKQQPWTTRVLILNCCPDSIFFFVSLSLSLVGKFLRMGPLSFLGSQKSNWPPNSKGHICSPSQLHHEVLLVNDSPVSGSNIFYIPVMIKETTTFQPEWVLFFFVHHMKIRHGMCH